jgi:hypothetical protein
MAGEFKELMESVKKDAIGVGIILGIILTIAVFAYLVSLF